MTGKTESKGKRAWNMRGAAKKVNALKNDSLDSNKTCPESKNIVHLVLNGPVTDGFDYQDNNLTKYQRRDGFQVSIITSQWVWGQEGKLERYDKTDYFNDDGVRVIRLPIIGKQIFYRKMKLFKGVYSAIDECSPNLLFIHGLSYLDIITVARYLKKHPEVIAYADNHSDFTNSATNWISKEILHKIIWRHCAQVVNPYIRKFYGVLPARVDFLVDMYNLPREKCELLVLGADDDKVEEANKPEIKQRIREKHGIASDDFMIVTGGKIDRWKEQTLLLMEAVQNIQNDKVRLIIFGSVEDYLSERVHELSDGRKIQYIGWIPSKETYHYIAAADLAVFPGRHSTLWEETVALGVPMLCKDHPGTHHVDLGGNVRFLEKDSFKEIQDEIENLLNNTEEYNKMKTVAKEEGMKAFSYREIARKAIEM